MKFSIVIPTYNRSPILKKTLSSIEDQVFPKNEFETLIIDDGSTDDTKNIIEKFQKNSALNIKYFFQKNQGPGQARNTGIDNSKGDIILFAGDDTILDKFLLSEHNKIHQQTENIAVLGIILWDESNEINDFMRFIAPNGPQFHFGNIKNIRDAGFDHFYSSNISVPKKIIGDLRFDPIYIYAAFEDIDFGLSLAKKGVKIFFNKKAIAYHSHFYDPESFYQRMIKVGKSFVILHSKYKKNLADSWRLKWRYAPFAFFYLELRLFILLSDILAKSRYLKKKNLKLHWYFNVCHNYSSAIMTSKKI